MATTKEIIRLIGRRNDLARRIGELKRQASLPLEDERVEDALVNEVVEECDRVGVDRAAGLKVLSSLIAESKRVQGVRPEQGPSPMNAFAKAVELQKKGLDVIRLDVGEPDFHPPKSVLEACAEAIFSYKTHYTLARGIPELRSALRRYLARKHNFEAEDDEVIVTPGERFAVYASLASVVGEGESAIVLEPSWPAYKQALRHIGAKPVIVRTELDEGWDVSVEAVQEAIKPNTKAIVLSSPNNPTGKIIDPKRFRELIELANRRGLTVVSDEIYSEYAYAPCPSVLQFTPEKYVLTSSFSKTWAMTGFRIGYAVSSKELIARFEKLVSLMFTSVPEFIQHGAIEALDCDDEAQRNRSVMKERIGAVCGALESLSSVDYRKPDGSMYVFPRIRGERGESFASRLLERGVSVTPGLAFGDYSEFIRISLAQPKEVILEGVRRMGELLA